jgi:hypothetical protein
MAICSDLRFDEKYKVLSIKKNNKAGMLRKAKLIEASNWYPVKDRTTIYEKKISARIQAIALETSNKCRVAETIFVAKPRSCLIGKATSSRELKSMPVICRNTNDGALQVYSAQDSTVIHVNDKRIARIHQIKTDKEYLLFWIAALPAI